MKIELQTIRSGYDRQQCWVHARCAVIPPGVAGDAAMGLITMQKLRLSGSDVFYELCDMRSDDGGQTWAEPTAHPQTLGRRTVDDQTEACLSDFTPGWHAGQGVVLGTGHTVHYRGDHVQPHPRPRQTGYSTYDPAQRRWSSWRTLPMPGGRKFFSGGAGSTQRLDLPDGDILLPIYFARQDAPARQHQGSLNAVTVVRCAFDGQDLHYIEHGSELSVSRGRGLGEPSLAHAGGRYFLTLRNDVAGYVATSEDGLAFTPPRVWCFDDGQELGNYNTQQHWVTHGDELYLVYTRRGVNNDHVFRHRAPLLIARVDTQRVCVIRETERILVPERGARLGNFGVCRFSEKETWVCVAEWMQTTLPDPHDCRVCEQYGSDNSVYLARVRFA